MSKAKNKESLIFTTYFKSQTPVAQEIADEVVSRRFQGEGVEFFFKSDVTDPPQIFDTHHLENTLYQDHFLSQLV